MGPLGDTHLDAALNLDDHLMAIGDFQSAYELCTTLSETGSSRAQVCLGVLCMAGALGTADFVQAEHWFRAASDQGDYSGSLNLGTLYLSLPNRGHLDIERAKACYELAVMQGCPYVPCL